MVFISSKRDYRFAFPVLTVALTMGTFDRLFATNFFTTSDGGMDMLWANFFWVWGHPEVYILILPAFGIYSEIISTFQDAISMAINQWSAPW